MNLKGSRLDYLLCLYDPTNPSDRPLPFGGGTVPENAVYMCTGSRPKGERGCRWLDPCGEHRWPRAHAIKRCNVILQWLGTWHTTSLAQRPPGSSEKGQSNFEAKQLSFVMFISPRRQSFEGLSRREVSCVAGALLAFRDFVV